MSEDRNPGAVRRGVSPVTTVRVTPAKSDSLQMSCRAPTEPPPDSTLVPQQNESNGIQRQSGEQVFAMDTADEQHFRRMPLFRPVGEFGEIRVSSESDSAALAPLQQDFCASTGQLVQNLSILVALESVPGSLRERSPGVWQVRARHGVADLFERRFLVSTRGFAAACTVALGVAALPIAGDMVPTSVSVGEQHDFRENSIVRLGCPGVDQW